MKTVMREVLELPGRTVVLSAVSMADGGLKIKVRGELYGIKRVTAVREFRARAEKVNNNR